MSPIAPVPTTTPAAPETPSEPAPIAGYKKGFFVQTPDEKFKLRAGARVQARYAYEAIEDDDNESAFSIPRARLTLAGHVFSKNLTYKFQTDFGKGSASLKDFYADVAVVKGKFHVRAGQWKRPFSRQQLNSSSKLELVDRAITDKAFGAGRDIGVAVHNNYEKSPTFEYAVGLFNGTGISSKLSGDVEIPDTDLDDDMLVDPELEGEVTGGKFSNVPSHFHPLAVARLGYNHGETKGYSEADLEGGRFRLSVGASGLMDFDADGGDDSSIRAEVDVALKAHGFAGSGAFYVASAQDGVAFGNRTLSAIGAHAQAGYVIAGRFQPVVRYGAVMPAEDNTDHHEVLAGFSVYFYGHNIKWQTDGGPRLRETDAADFAVDYLVRTQFQLSF